MPEEKLFTGSEVKLIMATKKGTTIAKAYIQVMPTTKGLKGNLEKALNAGNPGETSGKKIGGNLLSGLKSVFAVAAVGKVISDSISAGGRMEQAVGGIETLFKKHSDTVIKNAQKAYRTAGISANQYMEQATSFSASLLQSVGNDTQKAAKYADMAIRDMADNSNKMGTAMEDIQNAYQGFAKQNYTMLDNLKLGYGGTKTEMQRLLQDAQKITGYKYDIGNLSDVYNAIHVIQKELKITGTTSKEAATTIQGSFSSMKASFENFMATMATGGDMKSATKALIDSTITFTVDNLLPAIGNIIKSIPTAVAEAIPYILPKLITLFSDLIVDVINEASKAISDISGYIDKFTESLSKAKDTEKNGESTGKKFIKGFGKGLMNFTLSSLKIGVSIRKLLLEILNQTSQDITNLLESFVTGGEFEGFGEKSFLKFLKGFIKNRKETAKVMGQILLAFVKVLLAISSIIPTLIIAGIVKLVRLAKKKIDAFGESVYKGIVGQLDKIKNKVKNTIDRIKEFFRIKLKFKGIELPHFSIGWKKATGKLMQKAVDALKLPGIPDLSVKWYATGGIFDKPTVAGIGEAGPEAVVPLNKFWEKLDRIADGNNRNNGTNKPSMLKLIITLDGEAIAERTIEYINDQTIQFDASPILT